MDKIFKIMADFIGTREAEQCRSHHQKMEKKYHTFYKILKSLRLEFFITADPLHVKTDLETRGIFDFDPLLSEEDLEKDRPCEVDEDRQFSDQLEEGLEIDLAGKLNDANFLMGDQYERNFHCHGL